VDFVSLVVSMVLLMITTQSLLIGTAYAVCTGIGAVGTAFIVEEPATF
jgi:multidrug transporter EmrE-like cation transporter